MDYRNIWVHGIGPITPGYSAGWTQAFNTYRNLPVTDFSEVVWHTVYTGMPPAAVADDATRGGDAHGSYFVAGNVLVPRDLVAPAILG